ncbi:MAG: Glycosyl transferase family 4 [candidate division WS6 bacterium GW2011_GWF2_39_15]|uniref:Glycosyl transferase family 4 n=1 Tax=candidate division WS6 bacterium GW2011_GWF2_39_15 TaxID=1619100 RepID=A0A0G0MN62_9BACT|nr:MAG: Glycosyl transferase family 4 [candidate division WS6 bacterium GW2011_GWF2_39_15]
MNGILEGTTLLLKSLLLKPDMLPNVPEVYFKYFQFLPVLGIFFLLSLILTPLVGRLALKLKAVYFPGKARKAEKNPYDNAEKHIHKDITPALGGIAVIIPLLLALPLFLGSSNILTPFLIVCLLLLVSGFLDDTYNLLPSIQLATQLIASIIIAASVIDLSYINNPFGGSLDLNWWQWSTSFLNIAWRFVFPGDLLIIAWIVLCTNATKWVGGIGGLLEGNMIVAYLLLFILGIRTGNSFLVVVSIVMIGGIAGSMIYNLPPAKIFTGSTGKTMYGFIIAVLSLVNGAKVATTIMILALPLIDAIYVLVSRYIKYRPKNLIELMRINDTSHLHHQLYSMNLSPLQILLIEASISMLFGLIAVLTTGAYKFFILLFTIFLLLVGIIYINQKARIKKEEALKKSKAQSPESKYSY